MDFYVCFPFLIFKTKYEGLVCLKLVKIISTHAPLTAENLKTCSCSFLHGSMKKVEDVKG